MPKSPIKTPFRNASSFKRKHLGIKKKVVSPLKLKLVPKEVESTSPRPKRIVERARYDWVENDHEGEEIQEHAKMDPPTLTPVGRAKKRVTLNGMTKKVSPNGDLVGIPKLSPSGLICNECGDHCPNAHMLA